MLDKVLSIQFVSVTVTLILLMDGLGNIPIFLALLKQLSPRRQLAVIARELVIALIIMFFFAFCGNYVLNHLGIQNQSIQIAGGIILFIIALKMIFSPQDEEKYKVKEEPFIVPLAVPMVAGPTVLAAIMVFSKDPEIQDVLLIAIFLAWIITTSILFLSTPISRVLGNRGILAIEKLMGLILTILAVQLFLDGFSALIKGQ
jgi:MarC family membrane protein